MAEIMVVSGIMALFGGLVLFGTIQLVQNKRAAACANNIQAVYNALSEFGIDQQTLDGEVINITRLAPRYLPKIDTFMCPSCNKMYGTNFVYGNVPVCPGGVSGHAWNPTNALSL